MIKRIRNIANDLKHAIFYTVFLIITVKITNSIDFVQNLPYYFLQYERDDVFF